MSNREMLLRSDFTMKFSFKVLMGGFVNLVGAHGQGRRRTLSDLFKILPSSMPIIMHDLKNGEDALESLLDAFSNHHGQSLFVLHNVNLLQNKGVLEALIVESEKRHKCLLTVSETVNDLSQEPDTVLVIPPLTVDEVKQELVHRGMNDSEISEDMVKSIINAADPYSAMAEVAEPMELQGPKKSLVD